jgi:putative salt-induced outer membrane protein YdiY
MPDSQVSTSKTFRPYFLLTTVLTAGVMALQGGQALAQAAAQPAAAAGTAKPAVPPPPPKWETSAAAGLTLTKGNSDTLTFSANILSSKKWDHNEVNLGADATYGENDGDKNTETLHGFGQYNRLFGERTFGYGRLDALHDAIADVEYRLTFSPGAGYYFVKNPNTFFRGEFGPSFVYEKQGRDTSGYFTLRLAERFEHKFNPKTKMWQSAELLPQVDNFDNFLLNAEIGVETALTERLSLRTYLQDAYDNVPAPDRKKNDLKLVAALAYKF